MTKKEYSIEELHQIRQQKLAELAEDTNKMDAKIELVCADALLCEKYTEGISPSWQNYELCKEIVQQLPDIIEFTEQNQLAENVAARAAKTLYNHPRLKLQLLNLQRDAVVEKGGEQAEEAQMGVDELSGQINELTLNIMAADQGRFEDIKSDSCLRYDPVEWTKEYEDVIHLAEQKADSELADEPRGMGFCFAYWSALRRILWEDYNLRWRTPKEMNPRVIFD